MKSSFNKNEYLVNQELKNHNDAVLACAVTVNELKAQLIDVETRLSRDIAIIRDSMTMTQASIKDVYLNMMKLEQMIASNCNDLSAMVAKVSKAQADVSNQSKESTVAVEKISERVSKQESSAQRKEMNDALLWKQIREHLEHECKRTEEKAKSLCRDVADRPTGVEEVKKELLSKILSSNVDVAGVSKQLHAFRSEINYFEKKMEDIYNQISRLKSR